MKCKECGQPMLPAGKTRPNADWYRHANGCPLDDYKTESPAMKERPILFSGPMVNAIRERRKTQTRRMVNPQPPIGCSYSINGRMTHALCFANGPEPLSVLWVPPTPKSTDHRLPCPYGQPGDRLWVKETWCASFANDDKSENGYCYRATNDGPEPLRWKPSIFMPRSASRILLEITAVRVERLQDISEEDAMAEGCYPTKRAEGTLFAGGTHPIKGTPKVFPCAKAGYRDLWESINGPGSWESNPWVWVIEFKVLEGGTR